MATRGRKKLYNFLIIGDLHAPFIQDGYLEFCYYMKRKNKCNWIVFIGDLIDNHYSSYHESDPDLHSGGRELQLAKDMLKPWMETFPVAHVMIGNHDKIPCRKAMTSGLSKMWIKPISEVLDAPPTWDFQMQLELREMNMLIVHGDRAKKALQRSRVDYCSIVQGHYHADSYCIWHTARFMRCFAMQVGCGIDQTSSAFAYSTVRAELSCGIIKRNGESATVEKFDLEKIDFYKEYYAKHYKEV